MDVRTLTDGRSVTELAGLGFLVLFGGALVVDLMAKLAGVSVGPIGGDLALGTLRSRLWSGLVVGLIFGLAGIGLSMTYSILSFANFSHGDLLTVGAFTGWGVAFLVAAGGRIDAVILLSVRDASGASPGDIGASVLTAPGSVVAGLVFAAVATALISLAVDRAFYKPMRDRSGIALLIASVGVAFVLRYLVQFVYGSRNRGVTASASVEWNLLEFGGYVFGARGNNVGIYELVEGADDVGLFAPNAHQLMVVVAALVLMFAIHVLLQRTKLGTAMRAMADNKDLALVTGIPAERVVTWTWLIGGGLAGVSGYLYVLLRGTIDFNFGWLLLLLIFAAVILGGIGSIYGAMAGGVVIGVVFTTSTIWIPSDFNEAAVFAVMILVLLVRPSGIFSGVRTA